MSAGKVLVVDDESEIVKQFKRALSSEGYHVETAGSGEEGWEKYQTRYFDVVITDWRMAKMSGLELARKIDTQHPGTKVIIITAFGKEFERAIDPHHYHAFDYLKKPVDMDNLLNKVKEAIQRKDGVIAALEDWVETHLDEASRPIMATLSQQREQQLWSAKDILEEIKSNTERGRQEYQKIIQLTIDLLTRGKIQ
jgi:two-component system response regulator GlrR